MKGQSPGSMVAGIPGMGDAGRVYTGIYRRYGKYPVFTSIFGVLRPLYGLPAPRRATVRRAGPSAARSAVAILRPPHHPSMYIRPGLSAQWRRLHCAPCTGVRHRRIPRARCACRSTRCVPFSRTRIAPDSGLGAAESARREGAGERSQLTCLHKQN